MPDTPPSWPPRLLGELRAADARAVRLVKPLTAVQLNWRPSPAEWSIGQCLDHLLAANRVYLPAIADALQHGRRTAVSEIAPGWFGAWFIRNYIAPSATTRKAKAPAKIVPLSEVEPAVLDRFLASNEEARHLVERAGEYDVNRLRFKNPFIPVLRFTVGTGLEIVAKHQDRHLLQAERIRAAMR